MEATTGSGKTLSFGIPVFEILLRRETPFRKHEIGALIVAPTRELAGQIYTVFEQLAVCHPSLRCGLLVGGNAVKDNIEEFEAQGGNIFIGTPGRILDMKNRWGFLWGIVKYCYTVFIVMHMKNKWVQTASILCQIPFLSILFYAFIF